MQSSGPNLRGSVKLDLYLLKPWRVSAPAAALRLSYVILGYACISQDILGYPWLTMLHQDCCLILQPYPFGLEDPSDMSLEDVWHARPQLFFKCLLRPQNGRPPKIPSWTHGPDDIKACLVFFSAFEELKLPATGPIDSATTKLYEQSPTPIMYVTPCELMLGRVPLYPCSLQGNATPGSRPARLSTGSQMQPLWMA